MSFLSGPCDYVSTPGSSLKERTTFDGSVPYSITTACHLLWLNPSETATEVQTRFCLIGTPGHYNISIVGGVPSGMKSVLSRQATVSLRDFYVGVPQNASDVVIDIYVGKPSDAVPGVDALNTHLSYHFPAGDTVKIADMDGIVVPAGRNVLFSIKMKIPTSDGEHVFIHSVCDIDD